MKRSIRNFLVTAVGMILLSAFPVMASEVRNVKVDIGPASDREWQAGEIWAGEEPELSSDGYYLYDYSTTSHTTPKNSYTYTMDIRTEDGYNFSSGCSVSVRGAYEVTITSRSSDRIRIKAKTYPYYTLANARNIHVDGKYAKWDEIKYAGSYDVMIYYEDKDGDDHSVKKTTSKASIDISNYKNSSRTLDHISVRGKKSTSGKAADYIANGKYVRENGSLDDDAEDNEDYTFTVSTVTASTLNSASTSSSGSSSNGSSGLSVNNNGGPSSPGSGNRNGWAGSGNDWYYYSNGALVRGWVNPSGSDWYYTGSDGKMLTGWQNVNGIWYFMNPNHDGTYGRMLTGWQNVNGFWYLMNPNHDGTYGKMLTGWWQVNGKWYYMNAQSGNGIPFGAMYTNRTTPDGNHVNASGEWMGY